MFFFDYNRTVVGYHGTRLSVAREIVTKTRSFQVSDNIDDWMGKGIYFWEHGPQQAWAWAEERSRKNNWNEPIAVLGSMIRLGNCLDLLDPKNVDFMSGMHDQWLQRAMQEGEVIPNNRNASKYRDRAVFDYVYELYDRDKMKPIETSRAVYVPTGQGSRAWTRSWLIRNAHIQLCIRNPACIIGTWIELENERGGMR